MLGVDNYVPLTTNNFEVRIYGSTEKSLSDNSQLLTLATNDVGEITEEQDVITVHYGNGLIKFPSKVSFSDVDWTLNCYCTPSVLTALRDWRKTVYDPKTELMGLPSDYMRTAYFIRYDGQGNMRDVIKAPGVWCKGLKNGSMNQEGGSIVQIGVTLVISKAEYLSASEVSTAGFRA